MVQYNHILDPAQKHQRQNIDQAMKSQKENIIEPKHYLQIF